MSSHDTAPLLVNRVEACRLLGGVHTSTIIRLEADRKLTPVKLRGPLSNTYYRRDEVVALCNPQRERVRA